MDIKEEIKQFEILKDVRILTTLRRFRAKETVNLNFVELFSEVTNSLNTEKGDIFEEVYDTPNTFVNITKKNSKREDGSYEIFLLKEINDEILDIFDEKRLREIELEEYLLEEEDEEALKIFRSEVKELKEAILNLEEIEPIDILETKKSEEALKKSAKNYKKNLKQLAKLNEDITVMKYILQTKG